MQFHAKSQFARELKKIIENAQTTAHNDIPNGIKITVKENGLIEVIHRQGYDIPWIYYLCPVYGAPHSPPGLTMCRHSSHH